ncbi:MAG: DoxX family protein [Acidobacteriota bacterium]
MTENNKRPWAGYVVTSVPILFLLMDAVGKFVKPDAVVTGTVELGYQESVIVPLGIVLLLSLIIYVVPKTSVLGAILLTGYLGGAVATHVRIGNPLATHILFPVYIGIFVWLGLYLRDPRVRELLPLRVTNRSDV